MLDLAVENPDEDIVLVTRDRDFLMDGNDQGFHDDLLEDLVQIGAKDRVRVGTDLADVALAMADRSTTDLKSFKSGLQNEALVRFVGTLVRDLENGQLDPQECALPRATLANYLQGVGEVDDFAYSVRGSLGDDEAVAEVSFESAAEIVLTLPEGVSPEQGDATPPIYPQGTVVHLINKPLAFRGLVRLDRYGRPLGGEITKVTARPDDPGLHAWVPAPWSGLNVYPLAETLKKLNADLTKNAYKDPLADMMKKLTADQEKYRVNLDPLADMMKKLTAESREVPRQLGPTGRHDEEAHGRPREVPRQLGPTSRHDEEAHGRSREVPRQLGSVC